MTEDTGTRLARLEERVETLLRMAREDREARQELVGLIGTVNELQKSMLKSDKSLEALWLRVDPMLHSEPPLVERVRSLEDDRLIQKTRDRIWRGIATFVSPLVTALLVAWVTGAF